MREKFKETAVDTLLATRIGRAITGRLSLNRAVIFMLHRPDRPGQNQTGHRPEVLRAAFDRLYNNGIPVVPVSTLVDHYVGNEPFDRFSVAFTVDDGFEDQGSELLPVFLENQVPVTTFLITNLANGTFWPWDYKVKYAVLGTEQRALELDLGGSQYRFDTSTLSNKRLTYRSIVEKSKTFTTPDLDEFLKALERVTGVEIPASPPEAHKPLTWQQARRLETEGVRFGPHSENHRSIVHLTDAEAATEISGSWRSIRQNLSHPVPVFCWPIGRYEDYSDKTMEVVKENGLIAGLSAESGYIDMHTPPETLNDKFAMPRFPMPSDMVTFDRIISGMSGLRLSGKIGDKSAKEN